VEFRPKASRDGAATDALAAGKTRRVTAFVVVVVVVARTAWCNVGSRVVVCRSTTRARFSPCLKFWRDSGGTERPMTTREAPDDKKFKVAPPMTGGTRGVTTPRSYGDGYASLDARNCARMTSADKALMMPNTINPRWAPVKTTREVRAMKTKSRPTTVLA